MIINLELNGRIGHFLIMANTDFIDASVLVDDREMRFHNGFLFVEHLGYALN